MAQSEHTHDAHVEPTEECHEYMCRGVLLMVEAKDVTDEVIDHTVHLVDCDYGSSPIDWQSVFDDRLDGMVLADDRTLNLGPEYDTPAMRKIQRLVRKARANG